MLYVLFLVAVIVVAVIVLAVVAPKTGRAGRVFKVAGVVLAVLAGIPAALILYMAFLGGASTESPALMWWVLLAVPLGAIAAAGIAVSTRRGGAVVPQVASQTPAEPAAPKPKAWVLALVVIALATWEIVRVLRR
jgi:hypothetical protein